ncbi:hypothetical protein LCGC14_0362490 [marine sediment metagenome]|uniref:DUF551 domain-containing protein n=1 Tax=marine sediment metagenome TaxID=412755 RepID=A0A0F9VUZ9_9ZZZZ
MSTENRTQEIKSILLWLSRSMKKCRGSDLECLIRFCDDPISPWIAITPETMPKETGDYWVIREGVARPEIRTFEKSNHLWIAVFPTDPKITHYMPIPPLPEKK